jgi:outer membrane protein assembly factor BamA
MNPYRGNYAEFSSYFYRRFLGSTFGFTVINGEYRKYWQVRHKHILAFQTKARFTLGDVPFIEMSQIGNDDMLRGYPRNRFRDNHMFGAQLEYRFPVFWRMGLTTFVGAGDIFSRAADIRMNSLKYTIGTGFRFLLNPAERLNLRLDYGYGSQGGYFYLAFTEAF